MPHESSSSTPCVRTFDTNLHCIPLGNGYLSSRNVRPRDEPNKGCKGESRSHGTIHFKIHIYERMYLQILYSRFVRASLYAEELDASLSNGVHGVHFQGTDDFATPTQHHSDATATWFPVHRVTEQMEGNCHKSSMG